MLNYQLVMLGWGNESGIALSGLLLDAVLRIIVQITAAWHLAALTLTEGIANGNYM